MRGEHHFVPKVRSSGGARLVALVAAMTLALGLSAVRAGAQPRAAAGASDPDVVERSYIVTLHPGHDPRPESARLAQEHGGQAGHVYEHALRGFSFHGSEQAAASLARDPKVRSVVADRKVAIAAQVIPTGVSRIGAVPSVTLSGNTIGRVDVDVAILDTGIDIDHPDLNVAGGVNCSRGNSYDDGNGHGTHVAGTVAAEHNTLGVVGVAPGARLWAVRVLDNSGSGTWSSVICGVDWVTGNASTIAVANMSLGGSGSAGSCTDGGLREAICRSVGAGVTYAVAAGNSARDANDYVPATYDEVITVSALADFDGLAGGGGTPTCRTDEDDTFANFSNYGGDIDLIAPGVCINSTWKGGGYNTISGTSMATPHVAGAAALYKESNPGASPSQVKSALENAGNLDWDNGDDPDGSQETLINEGPVESALSGGGETTNSSPVASFTSSCTDRTCSFTDTSTDTDGTVTGWSWNFGDGETSTEQNPTYTYSADDTYTVTLTVTDNDGATNSTSQSVTVSTSTTSGITLSATGYKIKGVQHADLSWSGATSTNVDVYRNGTKITTTANDGAYTDNIGNKGGGSYTYKMCEAGTTTCSGEKTVIFS